MTPEAQAILQLLVDGIREGRFRPHDAKSFMGYGDVHRSLGIERKGPHWGRSLRVQGLEDLAQWLYQNDLPAITGLIVDQKNFRPGNGYFEENNHLIDDYEWWVEQVRQAIAFDWSPYVNDDPTPTLDELEAFTRAIIEGGVTTMSVEVRFRCEAQRGGRVPIGRWRAHIGKLGRLAGDARTIGR